MEASEYHKTLALLKEKIRHARIRAVVVANAHLLAVYWEIGNAIHQQEKNKGWGAKIIDQLAKDLKSEFPDFRGLSARNLRYMRDFSIAWPELAILQHSAANLNAGVILQQAAAKLPWYHICTLLDRVKEKEERVFYAQKSIENGWSRNILVHQITSNLYGRQGNLQHNFNAVLPPDQSDLAKELFKDPYKFDFLQLTEESNERDLENALIDNITKFLLELGMGFSYLGRQIRLEKDGQEYFIDLLFYHTKLHAHVVIDLKIGDFKPEYAGKMNFYLSVIDDDYRTKQDNPSIGLILCKNKNKVTVEYALRDMKKPLGVAEYQLIKRIPTEIKKELPAIEDLERELEKEVTQEIKPLDEKLSQLNKLISKLKHENIIKELDNSSVMFFFTDFLPQIRNKIEHDLRSVVSQFSKQEFIWILDNTFTPFLTSADIELKLIKGNIINQLGLSIYLEGFKQAGTKTFSVRQSIYIELFKYKYQIQLGTNRKVLREELYHKEWGEDEIQSIAENFAIGILDDITEEIGKIKN